jgi:hypothetical protein
LHRVVLEENGNFANDIRAFRLFVRESEPSHFSFCR